MITEIIGDALKSDADIIAHQTNCIGIMGGGIAKAIRSNWPEVFDEYEDLCKETYPETLLGSCQMVEFERTMAGERYIANLFGQLHCSTNRRETNYEALYRAFCELLKEAESMSYRFGRRVKVAMPKNLGCGLAGGDWRIVSNMIRVVFEKPDRPNEVIVDVDIVALPEAQG